METLGRNITVLLQLPPHDFTESTLPKTAARAQTQTLRPNVDPLWHYLGLLGGGHSY